MAGSASVVTWPMLCCCCSLLLVTISCELDTDLLAPRTTCCGWMRSCWMADEKVSCFCSTVLVAKTGLVFGATNCCL